MYRLCRSVQSSGILLGIGKAESTKLNQYKNKLAPVKQEVNA